MQRPHVGKKALGPYSSHTKVLRVVQRGFVLFRASIRRYVPHPVFASRTAMSTKAYRSPMGFAGFARALSFVGLTMVQTGVYGADKKPLLMPGKQTLYQRVVAIPDSRVYSQPQESGEARPVVPFTIFYVYARQQAANEQWSQVGPNSHGTVSGWIPNSQLIPWNQALTVTFKNPNNSNRVLLFRDRYSIEKLVETYDLDTYRKLYKEAVSGKLSANAPVVAIQPRVPVDIKDNFYLVPIKTHEDIYLDNEQARLLQVASVPLLSTTSGANENLALSPVSKPAEVDSGFRSGIAFVIDSTVSMGPYINRTRAAVRKIYNAIEDAGLKDKVNFGLTAFRDNLNAAPQLGYLTKTYVTLNQGSDPQRFLNNVRAVKPAAVSSKDYFEDAYSGVLDSIQAMDWQAYSARYIVLITDASARQSQDPLSGTGLDTQALRQLAYDQGIAIWVLHLRTPSGSADHSLAESQYKALSLYPGIGDFYYGVELGKIDEFGRVLEALTRQITGQVKAAMKGTQPLPIVDSANSDAAKDGRLYNLQTKVAKLGYALRMQYLQKTKGSRLPKVFDAWLVDRDFENPESSSIEVRVLLTRDQLSDLRNVLQQVLDMAEEGVLSPRNFLNDLKSMAAILSRDPARLADGKAREGGKNLAELGYMRDYIEDLPYSSKVMTVSLENWEEWSAKQQLEFVYGLESKIHYYQALHDNTDLWISLDGGSVDGDSVFPVMLDMLP